MRKPFYSIVSNKADTAGEILIYGVIGPDYWGEGIEAKKFVNDLKKLEQIHDRTNIRINSPGGSVWDGLAIFNAIRASQKDIHTYNDGVAFSMGAMIGLAGKTVHSAKGSIWMLHTASGMMWGNAKDMRATAEMLEKHDDVLASLIADKSGKSIEDVKNIWMNHEDHFLTSAEALESKLVDIIEDYSAKDMPDNAQNMSIHQVAAFYNERMEEPSESMISKVAAHIKNLFPNQNPNNSEMKLVLIAALAGAQKPTVEAIELANGELKTNNINDIILVESSFLDEAAAVTAENTRLTGELATIVNNNEALVTAQADLATANDSLTAAQAEIVALNTRLASLPGAAHVTPSGDDVPPAGETDDAEAILANLPHNKNADKVLGY